MSRFRYTTVNLNSFLLFYDRDETGLRATDFTVRVQVPGGVEFQYTYELQELSTDQVQSINLLAKEDLKRQRKRKPGPPRNLPRISKAHEKLSSLAFKGTGQVF